MRLSEVIRSRGQMPKNISRKNDLTQDYLDRAVKTRYNINGYPIFSIEPKGRSRAKLMLFVASPDETELLGQMALSRSSHRNGEFLFSEIYFDPEIQGKNLAVPLYKLAIIQYGLTIVSDESQTEGSESLWNRLARDPEVNVYVWDTESDKFRDFDPDDPDDVYYDPDEIRKLKAEADEINSKLHDQYMNGDIDDNEYNQLLSRYINPIYDEMESMERAQYARLVATKSNML